MRETHTINKDIDLSEFKPHKKSFAERFVDSIFEDKEEKRAGDIFADAFSDNGFTTSIVDAQHWAVEVLNKSDIVPSEKFSDLSLIEEVFCTCFIPYDKGEISLKEAKSRGIEMAEEFFSGSDKEIMYGRNPNSLEWFALHIYKICETVERLIKDKVEERAKIEQFIKNIGEYYEEFYFEQTPEGREKERRAPFVELVNLGVKIGFLHRDVWWLETHGEAAVEYYKRMDSWKAQSEGRNVGTQGTKDKAIAQREAVKNLILQAVEGRGVAFAMATIQVKSETLRELADETCRMDFEFRAGELLSLKWFQERVEDLEATGELVALVEKGLDKA